MILTITGPYNFLAAGKIVVTPHCFYMGANKIKVYSSYNIVAQTSDPGAGSSLETGKIMLVYE